MPKTDSTIQSVTTGTITQAVTATFHTPLSLDLSIETSPDGLPITVTNYKARLSAIYIHVHTIAAGATTLTLRVCPDATCDEAIVPDTTATIATGYTNVARGAVVFKVEADIALLSDTVYFTMKTNVGTCNLKELKITYERGI
jgi:hypothetical protein